MRLVITDGEVIFPTGRVLNFGTQEISSPGFVSIMGPSGAGKTTFLAVVGRVISLSRGTLEEFDVDPSERRVEWVFQAAPLFTRRTVADNVRIGPLSWGLPQADANEQAQRSLVSVGMERASQVPVWHLSGGEKQRVAVARAVATPARVILADEPTASLDPLSRTLVCDALAWKANHGALVMVATHDPYVAGRSQRTIRIGGGE